MWHYIGPRDLARAFRLSLEAREPQFGPFFICGPNTLAPEPTIERLAEQLDGKQISLKTPAVYEISRCAPLYDLKDARDGIGFEAKHDMREHLVREV
ncbi:MAG: hypothetical protein JXQ99_04185 [Hyphomicrobiaceae bacterium]